MLLARHRPLLAGLAAAVAVLAALPVLAPGPAPTVPVLTAAADLRWGAAVGPSDVTVTRVPASAVPSGALTSVEEARGRLLTSPVRRGEAITDVRLVGPALLRERGLVATGVRIADAGLVALLRPGAVIDVLGATSDDAFDRPVDIGIGEVVASEVRVLAVPGGTRSALGDTSGGALVVVAVTPAQAVRLAAAQAQRRLSLIVLSR